MQQRGGHAPSEGDSLSSGKLLVEGEPWDQASDGISPRASVVLRQFLGLQRHRLSAQMPTEGEPPKAGSYGDFGQHHLSSSACSGAGEAFGNALLTYQGLPWVHGLYRGCFGPGRRERFRENAGEVKVKAELGVFS